jgi:hypothetical protein
VVNGFLFFFPKYNSITKIIITGIGKATASFHKGISGVALVFSIPCT